MTGVHELGGGPNYLQVAFLRRYPDARGYVVIADIERPLVRRIKGLPVTLTNLPGLIEAVVS